MRHSARCVFAFLLIIISSLHSDEELIQLKMQSCLSSFDGMPSTIVGQHVNTATGEFVDFEVDLEIPSIDPLTLQRSYCSGSPSGVLGVSSYLNHAMFGMGTYEQIVLPAYDFVDVRFILCEAHGAVRQYNGRCDNKTDYCILTRPYHKGVTNCGSGEISARTNILNDRCRMEAFLYRGGCDCSVTTGAGNVRRYQYTFRHEQLALELQTEVKPNLSLIEYAYKKDPYYLKKISATNRNRTKTNSSIDVELLGKMKNDPIVKYTGCDGRKVTYHLKSKPMLHLTKVERTDRPSLLYSHTPSAHSKSPPLVSKKVLRTNRELFTLVEAEYYTKGENQRGRLPKIKSGDLQVDRVKMLKAPIGIDQTPVMTHLFDYYKGKEGKEKIFITDVYDALYHKSSYHYDDENWLLSLEKFTGIYPNHTLYTRQRYIWEEKGKEKIGHLKSTHIEDGKGRKYQARTYEYDEKGNVKFEKLYGNITGKGAAVIRDFHSCDCMVKESTFYDDAYNMVKSIKSGLKTHIYTYKPNTNLIESELILDGNKIKIRTFYDYDDNGAVIEKIVDNGTTRSKANFTDVTQRLITRYQNRETAPACGLPEVVDEFYSEKQGLLIHLRKQINSYSPRGYLEEQVHFDGANRKLYTLTWKYDDHGNVYEETDLLGNVITREFDGRNNVIEESDSKTGVTVINHYDFANRLYKREEKHPNKDHFISTYKYNLQSKCVSSTDRFQNETINDYDDFGRLIKTTYPPMLDENGVLANPVVEKGYDIFDNVTAVTDSKGNRTSTRYNILGKPIEIKYPDGTSEKYEYHLDGSLAKSIAKNGVITIYTTDFLGRTTKTETFSPDNKLLYETTATFDGFNMLTSTDAEGVTTTYTYDGAGRKSTIKVNEQYTHLEYDAQGNLYKTTQRTGPEASDVTVKIQIYNKYNQLEEARTEDAKGNVLKKEGYRYDPAGNRSHVTKYFNDKPSTTITKYNSHNLPHDIRDQEGNVTYIEYDYKFSNEQGQYVLKTTTTDPLGVKRVLVMDVASRPKVEEKLDPFSQVISHQETFYDSTGKKMRVNHLVMAPDGSQREVINSWNYNQMGEVLVEIEAEGTDLRKITEHHYNTLGQKDLITKPDNTQIIHTYDVLGRLQDYHADDNSFSYTFKYDWINQIREVSDNIANTKTIRDYDEDNNLKNESLGNELNLSYRYDRLNRPTRVILSDQSTIELFYNAAHLKAIKRISSNGEELYAHEYSRYDLSGNLLEAQMINNLGTITLAYDALGRNIGIASPYWSQEVPKDGYDPLGNLLKHTITSKEGITDFQYDYDHIYQLVSEKGTHNHSYVNDSLYNRVNKDGAPHQVNALNQLSDDSKMLYTYSTNGNLETMKNEQMDYLFEYDALDRLTSVTQGSEQHRYYYDFSNRRLSKSRFVKEGSEWQQGATIRYLYQGQNEIGAVDDSGKIVELRVLGLSRGAEIGGAVAHEIDGKVLAPIHDLAGSVSSLISPDQGIYAAYSYSAYGEVTASPDSFWNPWQFSSKRLDPETGFNNFGRRYYNPETGRWITPDPLGFEGGPNLYAYLLNNPLTHFDLYGLIGTNISNSRGFQALELLAKVPGYLVEICGNFMPVPALADQFIKTGRFMRGEGFTLENPNPHSHKCSPTPGKILSGISHIFVNGIFNSCRNMHETSEQLSKSYGGMQVENVYNASHGVMCDLLECAGQALGIRTRSVDVMLETIRDELKQLGPDGKLMISAHSQGGLITHCALKHLSEAEKAQIHVVTYGTAKVISDNSLGSAKNYISTRDGVPFLLNSFKIIQAGLGGNQSNIKFLQSKRLPIIDHPINNTYADAMVDEGDWFQQHQLRGI